VAEVCGLIPDAWRHETVAYGEYANGVRGRRKGLRASCEVEILNPDARYVRKAWRDLIKHIYEVDPLVCVWHRALGLPAHAPGLPQVSPVMSRDHVEAGQAGRAAKSRSRPAAS
jgi:hypothetical protein